MAQLCKNNGVYLTHKVNECPKKRRMNQKSLNLNLNPWLSAFEINKFK